MNHKALFPETLRVVINRWRALVLFVPALSGCIIPRDSIKVPAIPLPAQYQNAATDASAPVVPDGAPGGQAQSLPPSGKDASLPASASEAPVEWWRSFGSTELQGLIDRGLSNNPDIRIALNRIVQAKARAEQANAGKLPSLTAPLVAADQFPGGTTVGAAPAGSASSSSPNGQVTSQRTFQGSIRADWRLDLWGEQGALADSARFQLQRAVYERENVQRNLAASIASSYVDYLSLNDRLRTARKTEEVLNATLATIEKRVAAGDATLSELEQQRAAIFSARAAIPTLEQQRFDAIAAMAFLVGTVPGDLKLSDEGLDTLSIPAVLPGLPSALLLRRPDIRMAEAQLLAADADVAVARARLLPPIDLSAQAGYSSILLSQLFLPQNLFWSAVSNVTVSIFDAGRKQNDKVFSQALQEEMVETYVRSLHQAMKEVESALSSVRQSQRRLAAQQDTIQAAQRAWDISSKVYGVGGIDYLTLLDTERSYHRYLDDYQRTRMEYCRSYISLFQALGGGVKPDAGSRTLAGGEAPSIASVPNPNRTVEGITLTSSSDAGAEKYWQVELAGIYHRSTIGAAWRDLRTRYPGYMKSRTVLPRLKDRIEDHIGEQQSWYRLYVAQFGSPDEAFDFCRALNADQQRCRVVSSLSDETVFASAPAKAAPIPADAPKKGGESAIGTTAASTPTTPTTPAAAPAGGGMAKKPDSGNADATIAAARQPANERPGGAPAVMPASPSPVQPRQGLAVTAVSPATPADKSGKPGAGLELPVSPKAADASVHPEKAPASLEATMLPKGPEKHLTGRQEHAYTLQLGAFTSAENARISAGYWQGKGFDVTQAESQDGNGHRWYLVRTGNYARKQDAAKAAQAFRHSEGVAVMVTPAGQGPAPLPGADTSAPGITLAAVSEVSRQPRPAFTIQLGTYAGEIHADRVAAVLQLKGLQASVSAIAGHRHQTRYIVRAGSFSSRMAGLALIRTLDPADRRKALLVPATTATAGTSRPERDKPAVAKGMS